ncbi:hypothetical protein DL98DRAFT_520797 [Cadophora sp. DSE1049]|nr:hypothetical protein DL98DRAFT_520797 [Cadophora sp. DSE1049]
METDIHFHAQTTTIQSAPPQLNSTQTLMHPLRALNNGLVSTIISLPASPLAFAFIYREARFCMSRLCCLSDCSPTF